MSSGSRSIAAARARRAGEQVPPVSGTRPGTSIGSHAAFAPQPQQQYQQQSPNVRVARGQQPQMQSQMQSQMQQQFQQQPQQTTNGLPFSKLSISDAIGLITLRLGRVEQFIIDVENGETTINSSTHNTSGIPENSKIIDTSVLTNIVNRLDSLEKRENGINNVEQISKINDEIYGLNAKLNKINEQIIRLDNTLNETNNLLKNLTDNYEINVKETQEKFADFEYALAEIENSIQITPNETLLKVENINFAVDNVPEQEEDHENEQSREQEQDNTGILSVDLKNIIKQELANNV